MRKLTLTVEFDALDIGGVDDLLYGEAYRRVVQKMNTWLHDRKKYRADLTERDYDLLDETHKKLMAFLDEEIPSGSAQLNTL